jgi:hypothetical protein
MVKLGEATWTVPSGATMPFRTSGDWEELHWGRGDPTPAEGPKLLAVWRGAGGAAGRAWGTEPVARLHHAWIFASFAMFCVFFG